MKRKTKKGKEKKNYEEHEWKSTEKKRGGHNLYEVDSFPEEEEKNNRGVSKIALS